MPKPEPIRSAFDLYPCVVCNRPRWEHESRLATPIVPYHGYKPLPQFEVTFTLTCPIEWDSDEQALGQIASAIRSHLTKAHVDLVGPVKVTKQHLLVLEGRQ